LSERDWHFYWMRSEVGEHSIEYRSGEQRRHNLPASQPGDYWPFRVH
jgi:hypothetical protein